MDVLTLAEETDLVASPDRTQRYAGQAVSAGLATAALVLLSLNLRPAIASVPPLTLDIQRDVGWSNAAVGLVTAIPVLCMAALAPFVPRIAARWGRAPAATGALVLILVGTVLRIFAGAVPVILPISALCAGLGIAIGAGLAPAFVREWFPNRIGAMTGLYSGSMIFGAALGAAISVPLMHATGSWPDALAIWSLPALAGCLLWMLVSMRQRRHEAGQPASPPVAPRSLPWRSGVAWSLAIYLGLNSFVFYSLLAWMAPSYDERGWTQQDAGFLLAFSSIGQMVGALVLPRVVHRFAHRQVLYALVIAASLIGLIGIGFMPHVAPLLFIVIHSIGLGGSFALGLTLLSEYSPTPDGAARLTALSFLVSYVFGALGPVVMGALLGIAHSWELFYTILSVVLLGQLASALPLRRGLLIH